MLGNICVVMVVLPTCLAPVIATDLEVSNLFFRISSIALLMYVIMPPPTILNFNLIIVNSVSLFNI